MINEYENTLRRLIINVIGSENPLKYKVTNDRIQKWKEKKEIELKKNKGVISEKRLLYYSDFYDLRTIIDKNWHLFLPILKNKKRFEVFFKEMENFRDVKAHGRNLTSNQKSLLKGILSDVKNLITIYHNKNETKDDFFIEIIAAQDNLGHVWNKDSNVINILYPGNLRVGDEYEVAIEANDPKDRKIEYGISSNTINIKQEVGRFSFTIGEKLVGKNRTLCIYAQTPDTKYKNEDHLWVFMTVLPRK